MECPNEVCKPLPALSDDAVGAGVMIGLCCTPEGECGTKGSGPMSMGDPEECRMIYDSDPQCARLDLMGFEVASCCTEDGKCGLNGQALMMKPCGSIEEAMEMFGGFIELPAPAACVPGKGPPNSTSAPAPGTPADTTTTESTTTAPMSMTGAAGAVATDMTMTGAAGAAATNTSAMTSAAGSGGAP